MSYKLDMREHSVDMERDAWIQGRPADHLEHNAHVLPCHGMSIECRDAHGLVTRTVHRIAWKLQTEWHEFTSEV